MPIKVNSGYLLFNTASGALIELSDACWNSLNTWITKGKPNGSDEEVDISMLSELGFLTNDPDIEQSLLRIQLNKVAVHC